jgi:two-component system cell cycle sensor histidine kinase/response regulator CckA
MGLDQQSRAPLIAAMRGYAERMRHRASPEPARVLIVDDEDPVRKFVTRVLADAGYATVTAASGLEAIEAASKAEPFDIIVTDLMMPEMNGDELARRLRQAEPALKVLYLTGYSDRLFKEKVTLWEDEAFLDKPCSVNSLREAVSLLVYGRIEGTPKS